MYNVHCEDPNCVNCRQSFEGRSSEEKQDKILMTVKELLLLASNKKVFCVETCRKIKKEICDQINSLIDVLRERERDLCTQVDQEFYLQMAKIDSDVTSHYVDNLLKTSDELEKDMCLNQMVFDSKFDSVFWELKKFGQLSYEDPLVHLKKKCVKQSKELNQQLQNSDRTPIENIALSTVPLNCPFEAATKNANLESFSKNSKEEKEHFQKHTDSISSKEFEEDNSLNENLESFSESAKDKVQHVEECSGSVSSKELETDSLSDEDDMEIISKSEAATIPSELPSMPRKNRFRFSKKHSCFPSLFSKKPYLTPKNSISKHPSCIENKSNESTVAFIHEEMNEEGQLQSLIQPRQTSKESSIECFNPPFDVQTGQESSNKYLASVDFISSDSKAIKRNITALMSKAERQENLSFNKQFSQDSSSKSFKNSHVEHQGHDPSITLLSSFKKYLRKNPASEWLVPEKNNEQLLYSGNSSIFIRQMPFLVENMDQWLSTKYNQKVFSEWLYSAEI